MSLPKIKKPDTFEVLIYVIIFLLLLSLIGIGITIHLVKTDKCDCDQAPEKQTEEVLSEIEYEECDSIPETMYRYSDGSTGSLKYNLFASSVGEQIFESR